MEKVICFGVCDSNYIDMVRVALYSFYQYNDRKIKLFITDDTSEKFKECFKDYSFYDKLEFIDFCEGTKTKEYIDKHYDDFKTFCFCFDKKGILNVTIANEVTDYMSSKYKNDYEVILRLDLDVIFSNTIEKSIDNFIKSNKILGGASEDIVMLEYGRKSFGMKTYIHPKIYLNAGNFMYRTSKMYLNQFERMCNLFETIGFENFHYYDQDSVNVMYSDEEKYNSNSDGWILCLTPLMNYAKFFRKMENPIFIHYAGATKPFMDFEKYKEINLAQNKDNSNSKKNTWAVTYPRYIKYAELSGCSKEFIDKVKNNYENQKNDIDTISNKDTTKILLKVLGKIE